MARATPAADGLVGCTVASPGDLPAALVAAESFIEHHPDARFVIAVTAPLGDLAGPATGPIEVRGIDAFAFEPLGWPHLVAGIQPSELPFVARPLVVRALLHEFASVLSFDRTALVLGGLGALVPDASSAAGCTVSVLRRSPLPEDARDFEADEWLALPPSGLGCIGFDRRATGFLHWWAEGTVREPWLAQGPGGVVLDRRLAAGIATFGAQVDRDPGIGLAFWNVDERPLEAGAAGPMTGDHQLRLLLLPSFDPDAPWLLSAPHARHPRVSLGAAPVLASLCLDYRDRWVAAQPRAIALGDAMEAHVGAIAPVLRQVLHHDTIDALDDGRPLPPTPFDDVEAFQAWLSAASDTPGDLPLVAYAAWCSRPDLQEASPDLSHPDQRDDVVRWLTTQGPLEHPEIDWAALDYPSYDVPSFVRVSAEPFGVDVVGYLGGEFGLGEAGRRLVTALEASGVPVSTVAYRDVDHRMWEGYRADDVFRFDAVILAVNAPETPRIHGLVRPQLRNRYLIGYWHWEVLHHLPGPHLAALPYVDEVWAPSAFIADRFEPHAPGRTHAMPYPLAVEPPGPRLSRAEVGFSDAFTFLFVFDFYSCNARKNPIAVVEAFTRAFPEGSGVELHLKSINGKKPSVAGQLEELRWAARSRSDIVIRDMVVEPSAVQSMIAHCDCYVSLHRSEGVGSTISDAMVAGRPAIATGWSGNVEFMTPATSYLVEPRGMAAVGPIPLRLYPEDAFWVEPDVDHAAELMRAVVADRDGAEAKGRAAAADLQARYSPEVTGRRMRERLEAIWAARAKGGRVAPGPAVGPMGEPPVAILSTDQPDQLERQLARLHALGIDGEQVHLFQDGAINAYSGFVRTQQATVNACVELFERAFPEGRCHRSRWQVGEAENTYRAEAELFEHLRAPLAYLVPSDADPADDLKPFAVGRDEWLRRAPLMARYHRLVFGNDFAHRPVDEIDALLASWGAEPGGGTAPSDAVAAASLALDRPPTP
jgi:glycosyltransferase involved in cell wall biosynthesis